MRCPECGQINVAGSLFCERCGAELPDKPAPVAATPPARPQPLDEPAVDERTADEPTAIDVSASGGAEPTTDDLEPQPSLAEDQPTAGGSGLLGGSAPPAEPGVVCPECGHNNPRGFRICEVCGEVLASPEPPVQAVAHGDAPSPAPSPAPLPMAPEPGPAPLPAAEPGAPPAPRAEEPPPRRIEPAVAERPPAPPRPAPTPVQPPMEAAPQATPGQLVTGPQRGKVKLVVEQGMVLGKQFLLNSDDMLVGREDVTENVYPDIDLTGLDEGYVHRRHARLTFEGSFLFVTHLGGHNRTYVNNRPIADGLAHPLNVGDTVRFGKVVLRVVEA